MTFAAARNTFAAAVLSAAVGFNLALGAEPATRAAPLLPDDVDFLVTAWQFGLVQVRAAESAVGKSSRRDVRSLAEQGALGESLANDRLHTLAADKGVPLPEEIDRAHRALLGALEPLIGAAFDAEYVRDAGIIAHEQAVALFERARDSADLDVRRFAEETLPVLRQQLEHARRIEAESVARRVAIR